MPRSEARYADSRQDVVPARPAPARVAAAPAPPGAARLLGLQRQAGNAAVARLLRGTAPTLQRQPATASSAGPASSVGPVSSVGTASFAGPGGTGAVSVQRDGGTPVAAPVPTPLQVNQPQLLGPLLNQWRSAGLLDAPFRPPDVEAIPELPQPGQAPTGGAPATAPVAGAVAPLPLGQPVPAPPLMPPPTGRPVPVPPIPRPVPVPPRPVPLPPTPGPVTTPLPGPGPSAAPRPIPIPPVLIGLAVFLVVLLTPTSTAPPWMDTINPITGGPYGSPEEYDWVARLTPGQVEYLQHLVRARRLQPDPAADGDVDPLVLPQPEPQPRDRRQRTCFGVEVPRRGGHARHDAYATKVTGSPNDYFARTPEGLGINYDGRQRPASVWEVKVGFGWFFNPDLAGVRDATLARWDVQKDRGLAVATRCGYVHLWSHPDRHVARLVTARWGGVPPVLNIPE